MTNNFTPAKAGQQSKRLSKEEYAEKMKAEKEAVYQIDIVNIGLHFFLKNVRPYAASCSEA